MLTQASRNQLSTQQNSIPMINLARSEICNYLNTNNNSKYTYGVYKENNHDYKRVFFLCVLEFKSMWNF